jgi:NCS2 family nucleobase:cation symporter-2
LRAVFPVELSGVVIFMIGVSGSAAGLRSLLSSDAVPMSPAEWWVAAFTLAVMVGLNVWGKGLLRMLCALIGLAAGYAAAAFAGLLGAGQLGDFGNLAWVAVPGLGHLSWSFEWVMAVPFAIACLAAAMKALGTITVCQRMVDADWVRPDMRSATRGVLADGISTALSGLLNAVGTNTSTPSVGLASATGVASRRVGIAVGLLFLALGLLPKLTTLLALMPRSVMVSALLFSISFIIVNGLQVMTSRLLDARRTLVIGLALVAGAAVEIFPVIAAHAGATWRPIVGSSLVFATLVGLVLNLLFRIGVKQTVTFAVEPGRVDARQIDDFLRMHGGKWGARPDVVGRAAFAANQLVEAATENCWKGGPLSLQASFDEFNLDLRLSYRGEPLEFPERRPSEEEIRETDAGVRRLAGFMLRHNADRIRSEAQDGMATVHFHFDH